MKTATKTFLFAATSSVLLLGAAQAYAAENVLTVDDGEQRVWVFDKATPQVSELPTKRTTVLRRTEPLPELIVPLNTKTELRAQSVRDLNSEKRYDEQDLRSIDLVPDSPIFIGGQSSEFDTLEAQRLRGGYDRTLDINPLVPVAGAGLQTNF